MSAAFHKDIGTEALAEALAVQNNDILDHGTANLENGKVAVVNVSEIRGINSTSRIKNNAKIIIHAVGPDCSSGAYKNNAKDRKDALRQAYEATFEKAKELRVKTIAVPALSVGPFAFPEVEAAEIIADVMKKYENNFDEIRLCCKGKAGSMEDKDFVKLVEDHYNGVSPKPGSAKKKDSESEAKRKAKEDEAKKDQEEEVKKRKAKEEADRKAKEEADKESDYEKKKPTSSSRKKEELPSSKKPNTKKKKVSFEEDSPQKDSGRRDGPGSEQHRGQDSRNLARDSGKKPKDNSRDSHLSTSRDYNSDQSISNQRRSLPTSEERVVEVLRGNIADNLDKFSEAEAPETIKLIANKSAEVESQISDKAKNIDPVEYVEKGKKGHEEYSQYVKEKYEGVQIESLEQNSSNIISLKTLELVEKEIQNQDKVFDNKLARALNNLRKVPEHLDKDKVDIENTWKSLTTLDRRVLVDYHNISKGSNIDFMSFYKEAKMMKKQS